MKSFTPQKTANFFIILSAERSTSYLDVSFIHAAQCVNKEESHVVTDVFFLVNAYDIKEIPMALQHARQKNMALLNRDDIDDDVQPEELESNINFAEKMLDLIKDPKRHVEHSQDILNDVSDYLNETLMENGQDLAVTLKVNNVLCLSESEKPLAYDMPSILN